MSKSIAEWHAEINATMRAEKDRSRQIDNRTVNEITPKEYGRITNIVDQRFWKPNISEERIVSYRLCTGEEKALYDRERLNVRVDNGERDYSGYGP